MFCDSIGHLVSDTSFNELHEFAKRIGLKREWYQNKPPHPHYDLCKRIPGTNKFTTSQTMIKKAVKNGAIYLDLCTHEGRIQFKEVLNRVHDFVLKSNDPNCSER
jgi:hypothetical protein